MSKLEYSAPALDKGLTILEFMSDKSRAFSIAELAKALDRSKTEIYRILITLEKRGYIQRDERDGRYSLTSQLFDIGIRYPPRRNLVDIALPKMRQFSTRTNQSCHISIFSQDSMVVLANVESEAAIGFSVKVGFRAPMAYSTSGRLLYAFQGRHQQAIWLNMMRQVRTDRAAVRAFLRDTGLARRQGYLSGPSGLTEGITDVSVPIFRGQSEIAVATLAVPFISHKLFAVGFSEALALATDCASAISSEVR